MNDGIINFNLKPTVTKSLYKVEWIAFFGAIADYNDDSGERNKIWKVHKNRQKEFLEKHPNTTPTLEAYKSGLWEIKFNGAMLSNLNYDSISLIKMFPTASDISRAKKNRAPKKTIKKDWVGNGSGLIISKQGHIVTNHHVIKDIDSIEVEFKNELGINKFKAKVINSDESNDLAIIQIIDKKFEGFEETPNYNFDTEIAEVGTKVYAYGYPMALSVMGKEIKITDGIINSKMGFKDDIKTYQISAPIQGGNSGGPLFDEDGTLVGINSSGLSKEIADNVGYSIKSNYISNLISALPQKIELPYSYTIKWISTEKQIKRLSKYVVLIKVK